MERETNKDLGNGGSTTRTWAAAAAGACLLLAGLSGVALLVWWALAFHRSDEQLWMVPVGLVLLGTPVFACLSVCTPTAVCRRFELMVRSPALDPER